MPPINLNKKIFRLIENSDHGAVSGSTMFHYNQSGNIITATYTGGGVLNGQILAT